MPNFVINKIHFNSEEDFIRVINKYCTPETKYDEDGKKVQVEDSVSFKTVDEINSFGDLHFDFDKVLKMPETLNVPSSSLSTTCLKIYFDFRKANAKVQLANLTDTMVSVYMSKVYSDNRMIWDETFATILNFTDKKAVWEYLVNENVAAEMPITNAIYDGTGYEKFAVYSDNYEGKAFTNLSPEERCRVFIFAYEVGQLLATNKLKYDAYDWYTWRCSNWGTKWNSIRTYVSTGDLFITFETAWDAPEGIFEAIAEQNPDIEFDMGWADEDTGYNTGHGEVSEGEYTHEYYADASKEAYETAASLWGFELAEEGFVWDEKSNTYIYSPAEDDVEE